MSWMHNNVLVPSSHIMLWKLNIPSTKTSSLEFALFIKFIASHKRRQIGHLFMWLFFIIFRRTISSRSGCHKLRNTLYVVSIRVMSDTFVLSHMSLWSIIKCKILSYDACIIPTEQIWLKVKRQLSKYWDAILSCLISKRELFSIEFFWTSVKTGYICIIVASTWLLAPRSLM